KIGAGLSFYLNEEQLWKLKAEILSSGRYYNISFPESKFYFRAIGLEFNCISEYAFSEKFSLEAGLGVYFYKIFLTENSTFRLLGDQDKSIDLNLIAGASYQFYSRLSIGFRTSFGVIPMVKTHTVGKYGDMDGEQHLLNAL